MTRPFLIRLFAALALLMTATLAHAGAYESELPAALFTQTDLCRHTSCESVLPQATRFSLREGNPSFVRGFRDVAGREELAGYVFLTTDVTPEIVGYSGKPIVTLVGMDAQGRISGARILKHSEPILLAGLPESELSRYIAQYTGTRPGARYELGKAEGDHVAMDAVSGATVTVIAENQAISRGSYAVARQVGLVKAVARPQARFTGDAVQLDWATLAKEGGVRRLRVSAEQAGAPPSDRPFIDLWFGYLNAH
jgi:NosR/NirI family nitrous oxide reductase transcriptional regulator